jgi:hypothetical protein
MLTVLDYCTISTNQPTNQLFYYEGFEGSALRKRGFPRNLQKFKCKIYKRSTTKEQKR